MIFSIGIYQIFDSIQYQFITKTLSKVGLWEKFHNPVKIIHEQPTANAKLNSEKLNSSPLKLG